ncbi:MULTISPECIES: DNA-directed RNA polymerase subunit beta' [unclassified Frigoribacterium]|uniref:DNA-directed RNA polymerase subunit beta' n=1 Tax=unclassified Frigoribacterium TaxID=2627005 RepID=UPI00105D9BA1|nr:MULTISPECIES: DNA-directed RNA polymerase subunit beta' [unclassified Frigoribacterium]MBD8583252.1 DNA-directed RNA polymerase subunit beta' [Frigoribacterium sp. CFBP 8766]MBD8610968.1 DNA-directed RNA polymerase subunit beta' [Frigoribacterium sp. CFBP 13729]MBF4580477.1 DNA-directed RNA polymerase subunit beta' [Frigoribacterium sp. VKM Ac-2530]TDT63947.1 DNA-directed RNA polymerase subunit beta' [Frigoribacterium sp. PhB116]TWX38598.1 DNA-directed RNA polymerase subunit beta' [Frigorib
MIEATTFDELRIGLATAENIRAWSHGEVKKPETINYRTLKPEKDGLFGEQIFGPSRDWECACGKYKRVRFKGIVCERCGVEVTKSSVRRERMGHIELAAPVTHIWYFKGVPSRLGYLLDMAPKDLEKVIYFAAYMVISIDDEGRHADMPGLENELRLEIKQLETQRDTRIADRLQKLEVDLAALEEEGAKSDQKRRAKDVAEKEMGQTRKAFDEDINRLERVWEDFRTLKVGDLKPEDAVFHELQDRFGMYFEAHMGAEAIKKRLEGFDLTTEAENLHLQISEGKGQKKIRAIKRLRVVSSFLATGNSPAAMVLDVVPVIPPELRPMVQLDGGRFATSDLNDLYRRVINRNNRLRRLLDLGAPEIIVNNEKRMLQEAVDALFDNGRRGRPVTGTGNRALKSLSDMLKGKQGRFRQNLLGKRVDYSGRSVIIVGPTLKLHQCGLPKQMALELFKPFVIKRLIDLSHAQNIKSAKRMVERSRPQVWDVLEEIIRERPVLLNRAPTLHRLGIQAFEPQLVEGKAIQLHPLVCAAFNADFDGDQMAVHLPLSVEAQAEARILMLASNNILKPSDGRPVTLPAQDMIIGLHYLTTVTEGAVGEGRAFSSVSEAILAKDQGTLDLNAMAKIRMNGVHFAEGEAPEGYEVGQDILLDTTLGRALFNENLPADYPFVQQVTDKGMLSTIVNDLAERYPKVAVAAALDNIKDAGFYWASRSGVTVALSDVLTPPRKPEIVAGYEKQAAAVQSEFDKGLISDAERRADLIKIWTEATNEVAAEMRANFPVDNTINRMVTSGARGNWLQVRNIAGMRGLVNNPKGDIIPRPIISSYREGLSVAEYFIATHGARKGLADTALRTADSGYLTRRLVDVSQDVIIREDDCGTSRGLEMPIAAPDADGVMVRDATVENTVFARSLAAAAVDAKGTVLAEAGADVGDVLIDELVAAGVETIKVRSVLTCEAAVGVCAQCYGRSLATGNLVDIGEAVGIIAAQSIGEPGTQLTMRTFHTGGSASADDITQGLPRVTELFEARTPKGASPIADGAGRITIEDTDKARRVILNLDNGDEPVIYPVLKRSTLLVEDGQHVELGAQIIAGAVDPKEVLRVKGVRAVQQHLVGGVQDVYRSQGVPIHDKHIEVIVRQMLRKVTVVDHADTDLLPGELVDRSKYNEINRAALTEGKRTASARQEVMGITKASLATESWLSAASFQETTRVLTQAAMEGKSDPLVGLKENVIIGKLIPAGTGLSRYRDVSVEATEEAKAERYPNRVFTDDASFTEADLSFVDFDSFSSDDFTPGTYN